MTEPVTDVNPNRRAFIMLGVAGGLVALLLVYNLLFAGGGGGGGDDEAAAPTPPNPATSVPATTTTTIAAVESFEVFSSKNPFIPARGPIGSGVVTPPLGGGGSVTTTTLRPGITPTTVGGGTGTTTTTRSGGGTGTTTPTTAAEPRRSERVALLDVFEENGRTVANVRVNDTAYRVGEGETFATSYRVISLDRSAECGRFVFGDDQFRLCAGEEVVK